MAGTGFHTGALLALFEATGWDPRAADVIVGTSSGSIIASILRAGVGPVELHERVMAVGPGNELDDPLDAIVGLANVRVPRLWRGPAAPRLLAAELQRGRRLRASNVVLGALPRGRSSTSPLRPLIETFQADGWPADPLWIPVTDMHTGRRGVLGRDRTDVDLTTAVEASCAIPVYFAPVEIDGRLYVDGGMRSPDNADLLVGADFDVVVVSSPLSVPQYRPLRSPVLSVLRAYPRRRLIANVAALRSAGTEVLVLQPDEHLMKTIGVNAMSRARLRPVVEATVAAIGARLAELDRSDPADPDRRARNRLVARDQPRSTVI